MVDLFCLSGVPYSILGLDPGVLAVHQVGELSLVDGGHEEATALAAFAGGHGGKDIVRLSIIVGRAPHEQLDGHQGRGVERDLGLQANARGVSLARPAPRGHGPGRRVHARHRPCQRR
jgi:hypothetical protein